MTSILRYFPAGDGLFCSKITVCCVHILCTRLAFWRDAAGRSRGDIYIHIERALRIPTPSLSLAIGDTPDCCVLIALTPKRRVLCGVRLLLHHKDFLCISLRSVVDTLPFFRSVVGKLPHPTTPSRGKGYLVVSGYALPLAPRTCSLWRRVCMYRRAGNQRWTNNCTRGRPAGGALLKKRQMSRQEGSPSPRRYTRCLTCVPPLGGGTVSCRDGLYFDGRPRPV